MQIYAIIERLVRLGMLVGPWADKAVEKYAKDNGISKGDAWRLLAKQASEHAGKRAKKIRKYANKRIKKLKR